MSLELYEDWAVYDKARYEWPAETDPVHGLIRLGKSARVIMNSRAMKRLKNLKQLGATSSWCHAAEHTRFTHSRGVAHLAQRFGCELRSRYPELELRAQDIVHLEVAGAVHDIGHGPLSHCFQDMFMPKAYERRGITAVWEHEHMSCKIIDHMKLTEHPDLDFTSEDVQRIKDLVMGDGPVSAWSDKEFLLGVVACKGHGIDVDRMDYIARDALMCKASYVPPNLSELLIDNARVVGNRLCYEFGARDTVQNFFKARSDMHVKIYQAQKTRQAELMLMDALLLADCKMNIVENWVEDVDAYLDLDDTILSEIKRMKSNDALIREAQKLLRRLDMDDMYLECAEVRIPPEKYSHWKKVTELDVLSHVPDNADVQLQVEDIAVQNVVANMGSMPDKCSNPLTLVPFVRDSNLHEIFYEAPSGPRMVQNCEERIVRLYLKKEVDISQRRRHCDVLHAALTALMRGRGVGEKVINKWPVSVTLPASSATYRKRCRQDYDGEAEARYARTGAGTSQSSDAEDDFVGTQTQYGGTQVEYGGTPAQDAEMGIICSQLQD